MPALTRRPQPHHPPRLKPLVVALSLTLGGQALANPNGATVVRGNASVSSSGNTMTVTNSPGAIINWQNFSIGADEVTRFVQQSTSSTVLNRVTGSDPSSILGSLQSNGHVWLINPNGVIFGQGARIDVAGLVASSLNVTDQDFVNGLRKFSGSGGEGAVKNAGNIAASGGSVLLFAPNVENSGVITTDGGEIILAAGHSVELADSANPALRVTVTAGGEAINLGQIISQGGSASMVGGLVKQSGLVSASSAVAEGGKIYLRSSGQVVLASGSRTEANGTTGGQIGIEADALIQSGTLSATGSAGAGGSVAIQARFAGLSGAIDASGVAGGEVAVDSDAIMLTGNIAVAGTAGAGGSVDLDAVRSLQQTRSSVVDAGSLGAEGGRVRLATAGDGSQYLSGSIGADGRIGGQVSLEGGELTLAGARISATGAQQGGRILAGGGRHGDDATVQNARVLKANAATLLDASARENGNGGEVIVWGDEQTVFVGQARAAGGSQYGDGGFVEISSRGKLGYGGEVDVTAQSGQAGTVLFDPYNIHIESVSAAGYTTFALSDPTPAFGDGHGQGGISVLPNGNIVVASPQDSNAAANAGAVYLYQADGTLVSTLYGAQANDQVGSGNNYYYGEALAVGNGVNQGGITVLADGAFVVSSPNWNGNAGAVSWGSAESGVNGPVSSGNSLVGGMAGDSVGVGGVVALANGNYLVNSPYWNGNAGAVSWGNGNGGTVGAVGASNSLVGSTADDYVGYWGVTVLANGNYLVNSQDWDNGLAINAGAVTWGNGGTGTVGAISSANSLVGSTADDAVGQDIIVLSNGNYVVSSPRWDNGIVIDAGAVTWGNGSTGVVGAVDSSNSLVGSQAGDYVGSHGVTALSNGNYVVSSAYWHNGLEYDAGAVTWGNGSTGTVGAVSSANSLVGGTTWSYVGGGEVTALSNGHYVVSSPYWDNGLALDAGAVTWGNGNGGTVGVVDSTNSLVGSTNYDFVGGSGITALGNGNYVVHSPYWDNGNITQAGAVTWGNGNGGTVGVVGSANSLVGSTADDMVGAGGIIELNNGHYVVSSLNWDNGLAVDAGAVTWAGGNGGTVGVVSASNSLVGGTNYDYLGGWGTRITTLSNGNYVVSNTSWDNGLAMDAGAVTWADGNGGTVGLVDSTNSLVGSTDYDNVGNGGITVLSNGHYVVSSLYWNNHAGAATWGNGNGGTVGVVDSTNSLVGSTAYDYVGMGGITALSSGHYVVSSSTWDNGLVADAGAVTWGNGNGGTVGEVDLTNSLVGGTAGDQLGNGGITVLSNGNFVVSSAQWDNGLAVDAGAVTWGNGHGGAVGVVDSTNSLVGSTDYDNVGYGGITVLDNGNYVISSPQWNGYAGAVTWANGSTGIAGTVDAANSLVFNGTDGLHVMPYSGDSFLVRSDNYATGGNVFLASYGAGPIGSVGGSVFGNDAGGDYYLDPTAITSLLNSGANVTLQAHNDINVNTAIDAAPSSAVMLSLQANNDINLNADITSASAMTLHLQSDADFNSTGSVNVLGSGAPRVLDTAGGLVMVNGVLDVIHALSGGGSGALAVYGGFSQAAGADVFGFNNILITQRLGDLHLGNLSTTWTGEPSTTSLNGAIGLEVQNGNITQQAGTRLAGSALGVRAPNGSVTLTENNQTGAILASVGGDFSYTAASTIRVSEYINLGDTSVPSMSGITAGGQVNLVSSSGDIVFNTQATSTSGNLSANAAGNVTVDAPLMAAQDISLTAGGDMHVNHNVTAGHAARMSAVGDLTQKAGAIMSTDSVNPGNITLAGNNVTLTGVRTHGDIDVTAAGDIVLSIGSVTAGGAGAMDFKDVDDQSFVYTLPFDFTFYGENVGTTAYISSNGIITFGGGTYAYSNSTSELMTGVQGNPTIAPAWDDWVTWLTHNDETTGWDVYVLPSPDAVTVRWNVGHYAENSVHALFEAVLSKNGDIQYNYGPANTATLSYEGIPSPTIGASSADGVHYTLSGLNGGEPLNMNYMNSTLLAFNPGTGNYNETILPTQGLSNIADSALTGLSGRNITLTANAGQVTSNSGLQDIDASGKLTLHAANGIGNAITPLKTHVASLEVTKGLNGVVNILNDGDIAVGGIASSGQGLVTLSTNGNMTVNGAVGSVGDIILRSNGGSGAAPSPGDVTLNNQVASTSGNVVVAAAGNFINNVGASALAAAAGRWLVYAANPASSSYGGLDSGNRAVWGQTYTSYEPASVSETGNRYVFAWQPTATLTGDTLAKTYGDDLTGSIASAYTVTGLHPGVSGAFLADTAADAFAGTPGVTSAGAVANVAVTGTPYVVAVDAGTLTALNGYQLAYVGGSLSVDPLAVVLTGTRVYDATDGILGSSLAVGNLVEGDSGVLTGGAKLASRNAGSQAITDFGDLALSSGNYTLSGATGTVEITPAPLSIAAVADSKTFDGNAVSTLAPVVSGLTGSDSVTGLIEQAFDSHLVGARTLSVTGSYTVNDGNGGNNYILTTPTAAGSILADLGNFVWQATAGGAWEDAGNWNQGVAPLDGSQVTLPAITTGITFNSTSRLASLNSQSDFTLLGGSLTLGTGLGEASTFSGGAGLFLEGGSLALNGASLFGNVTMNGGTLGGYGTVVGDLNLAAGTLSPGFSPGTFVVDGDLTLGSASTLVMELGDPGNPASFDQINVSGHFTMDGALKLAPIDGSSPVVGDHFILFTFGSESGSFTSLALPDYTVSLSAGQLEILSQAGAGGTLVSEVLLESMTQISTESGLLFTVAPAEEDSDENESNNTAGMVCSS